MLGIVLKFYDVVLPIITAQELRLRPSAHSADMLYRFWHWYVC